MRRHSFCGFPFGNAPTLPGSAGTLLSSCASPAHGAGSCAMVLLAFLLQLWKTTQRSKAHKYLSFSVRRRAEMSGLCQILWGKGALPREAAFCPQLHWGSWLTEGCHQRRAARVQSKVQKWSEQWRGEINVMFFCSP